MIFHIRIGFCRRYLIANTFQNTVGKRQAAKAAFRNPREVSKRDGQGN
jgi:hypothetical protein